MPQWLPNINDVKFKNTTYGHIEALLSIIPYFVFVGALNCLLAAKASIAIKAYFPCEECEPI